MSFMRNPKVSIIIPTINEGKYLKLCLSSIERQAFKEYEIIVVDGYSKDNTVKIAKEFKAKVVRQKPSGAGNARNLGVKKSKGEILSFVDADTILPEGYFERLVEDFKDEKVVAVSGPLCPTLRKFKHVFMYYLTTDVIPWLTSKINFFQFQGSNMAFRRLSFIKMGGFHPDLKKLEDNELGNRARRFGKVLWDKNLYIFNNPRRFEKFGYFNQTKELLDGYLKLYFGKETNLEYKPFTKMKKS